MFKKLLCVSALTSTFVGPTAAHAEDQWGCKVLLCLANPNGPMALAQCVDPIKRLYAAIFKPRPDPFPTCTMSSGEGSQASGNYAYVAPPSYYDACPAGTNALPQGSYAATGVYSNSTPTWPYGPGYVIAGRVSTGVGDGSGLYPVTGEDAKPLPVKVCVANPVATQTVDLSPPGTIYEDRSSAVVTIYDRVVYIDPAASSFNINVVINNALYRNVRPVF